MIRAYYAKFYYGEHAPLAPHSAEEMALMPVLVALKKRRQTQALHALMRRHGLYFTHHPNFLMMIQGVH